MKENYESLELEVIVFDIEDVITTSGGTGEGGSEVNEDNNGSGNDSGNGG